MENEKTDRGAEISNFTFPENLLRAELPPEEEKELALADFGDRDLLVGSVRSDAQYRHCLRKRYYYVPAKYIREEDLPIRSVAIYCPARLSSPGIRVYGEVIRAARLRRFRIPFFRTRNNPLEWYYAFAVRRWNELPAPILAKGEGVNEPKFSNLFLLRHTDAAYALFGIESGEQFRLYVEMRRLCGDVTVCDTGAAAPVAIGERLILAVRNRNFEIYARDRDTFLRMPMEDFTLYPKSCLTGIREYLHPEPRRR